MDLRSGKDLEKTLEEFFSTVYKERVTHVLQVYPKQKNLYIDYHDLETFNAEIASMLETDPIWVMGNTNAAINLLKLVTPAGEKFQPHYRFVNLPERLHITSSKVRAEIKGRLIALKAFITALPPPFIVNKVAVYTCTLCDAEMKVWITEGQQPPRRCESCKKFALQIIDGEGSYLDVQEGEACFLPFRLEDDLVGTIHQESYAILNGIVRVRQDKTRRVMRLYLDVKSVEVKEKRVKVIDDLPQDVVDDIDAFDEYPKASIARTPIPTEVKRQVLEKGGYKCASCKVSWNDAPLEIDHIIPVASGIQDVNNINNLQVLCRRCNSVKRASLPFAFAGRKQEETSSNTSQEKLTEKLDIDVVLGRPKEKKKEIEDNQTITHVILQICGTRDTAPLGDIIAEAMKAGYDKSETIRIINNLMRIGWIYEKEWNHYRVVGGMNKIETPPQD